VLGVMLIAAMPTKCMTQMPEARSTGAMTWTFRPSWRARAMASVPAVTQSTTPMATSVGFHTILPETLRLAMAVK
jgi:hypothetical protein